MLGVVGPALEARYGAARFTAIYLGLGAAGWLGSYTYTKCLMDSGMWNAAGKYQEGVGSSPATCELVDTSQAPGYGTVRSAADADIMLSPPNAVVDGLAALAAWVLPPSTLLGLPSHSFATTAVAVHILPHLLGGKLHEVVTADVHELVLSVALWGLVNTVETTFPPAVGPAAWLAFYHLNTALTLVRRTLSGTRSSLALTDHPAHFFGTLTVVPFAALLTSTPCQAPLAIKMTLGFLGCRAILSV
jgi:hypothetical protein